VLPDLDMVRLAYSRMIIFQCLVCGLVGHLGAFLVADFMRR
jgi:hypothetical protein